MDSNDIRKEEISDHDTISSTINDNVRLLVPEEEEGKDENKVIPRSTLKQASEYLSELVIFRPVIIIKYYKYRYDGVLHCPICFLDTGKDK